MSELHWHPFYEEWVAVSADRQARPNLPKKKCPFCPGSPKVPAQYEAISVKNDFPSLHLDSKSGQAPSELFGLAPATGACEVVLYSQQHTQTFSTLTESQVDKVLALWKDRYEKLGLMNEIKYVFIFENKGEVIGATIPHPHGQIYAFGHVPPKMNKEIESQKGYHKKKGKCLGCELARAESEAGVRVVLENQSWVASVPWYARYPYEVQVLPRRHAGSLIELNALETKDLNEILRDITRRYDGLFGFSLPYMMLQHAAPTDGEERPYYHFRISFLPLHRGADKLKFIAGCETGAGMFITDMSPEWAAEQLRNVQV